MPAQDGVRAHDERGVPPGPTEGTDQHHQGAVRRGQLRTAHRPRGHDELLSEKGVLGQQLGASTKRVASEPSRGGCGPERFPDRYAQAAGNRSECSDQRSEHGSLSRGAGTKNKTGSAAANSVIVESGRLVLSVLATVDTKTYEPMVCISAIVIGCLGILIGAQRRRASAFQFWGGAVSFLREGPLSVSLWALCTSRSRMASARLGSPIQACHWPIGS